MLYKLQKNVLKKRYTVGDSMNIVVQKFGGTSICNKDQFKKSIIHIQKELKLNHKVICVVSAMGRKKDPYATDTLKNLINFHVSKKEQDRLMSIGEIISSIVFTDYLIENDINAIALSTKEIGIITNNNFTNADIIKINDLDILNKLSKFDVLVIPGFQGQTLNGEVTTLGRGGSDTTAIALGIALDALYVEIISDVEGVFTADPRIVKEAIKIPKLNFDVLVDMTKNGSKVLHAKGALLAKYNKVNLRFVAIDDFNCYTEVEDENVLLTNLSYQNDYIKYDIEANISDKNVFEIDNNYYIHSDDEELWKNKLNEQNKTYERTKGYSKITIIKYDKVKSEQYIFVETKDVNQKLCELHQKLFETG
ncbi:aspartate kinase [Mycoplasmatota bacterium]|nr:aspartate kinase [Mycoplasmatota bacterium]